MTTAFVFWLLMLLWLISGGLPYLKGKERPALGTGIASLHLWVLLALLGWSVFGAPIRG